MIKAGPGVGKEQKIHLGVKINKRLLLIGAIVSTGIAQAR